MKLNVDKINRELDRAGWGLGMLAKEAGTSRQSLYNWLKNGDVPTLSNIEKLASALSVDAKDLILP